jgi:hypothetical protein
LSRAVNRTGPTILVRIAMMQTRRVEQNARVARLFVDPRV